MPITVWATGRLAPPGHSESAMCADARMIVGAYHDPLERGTGQPGWDWALNFNNLRNLINRLGSDSVPEHARGRAGGSTLRPGNIRRLAIMAHGDAGIFFINGTDQVGLSPETFRSFRPELVELSGFLTADAEVLLMGCTVATRDLGTRLLELLSCSECWPGRTVVGFTRTGIENDLWRTGSRCRNPGMRLTDYGETALPGTNSTDRPHPNINLYAWADNNSIPCKVGRNGVVLSHAGRALASDLEGVQDDYTYRDGWGHGPTRDPVDGGSLPPYSPLRVARPLERIYDPSSGRWTYRYRPLRVVPHVRSYGRYRRPGPIR